ncbi:MAG: DUF2125 domain-containing protein [Pseudomonadota bacterium]
MKALASRWFLYGPFIFAGVILAGYYLLWRSGAALMRESLDDFAAAQKTDGTIVAYEPLSARGFPFFLRGAVENFSIARGADSYRCAKLFIDALPYAPDRIIFSCGGAQQVAKAGEVWTINAKDARASVERDQKRGWLAKLETGAASAFNNDIEASVSRAIVNLAPSDEGDGRIDASFRIVGLGVTRPASGYAVDRIDAAATVLGGADGQTVKIHGLEAVSGQTIVKAEGEIAIPAGENLHGRLNARVEKPAGLAQTLSDAGLLDANDAKTAQTALAMLTVASGGALAAPIDFANDEVRLAGLKIAQLKRTAQP